MKKTIYILLNIIICILLTLSMAGCGSAGILEEVSNKSSLFTSNPPETSLTTLAPETSSVSSLLSSQSSQNKTSTTPPKSSSRASSKATKTSSSKTSSTQRVPVSGKLKGLWLSYIELNFAGKTQAQFQSTINTMFDAAKSAGLNAVFCHVRPNSDAYYPSSYFPWSKQVSGTQGKNPGYDPLAYMVTAAHARGLSFHAWINPYRVIAKATDASGLADTNPAKKWFADGSRRVLSANGGLYYNPANTDVQKLVINGIKEILDKYPVDGIHFDDYFYPTTDAGFDSVEYGAYQSSGGTLSLGDWRRANVNVLVNSIYAKVHSYKGVVFGISPAAHISTDKTDKNYTNLYADIAFWISRTGYVDYIAPQLYFGYEYPQKDYCFDVLLQKWASLPRDPSVKMYVGLAAYKIGDQTRVGSAEWCDPAKTNILARETTDCFTNNLDGIIVYSYDALVSSSDLNKKQRENLVNVLKK